MKLVTNTYKGGIAAIGVKYVAFYHTRLTRTSSNSERETPMSNVTGTNNWKSTRGITTRVKSEDGIHNYLVLYWCLTLVHSLAKSRSGQEVLFMFIDWTVYCVLNCKDWSGRRWIMLDRSCGWLVGRVGSMSEVETQVNRSEAKHCWCYLLHWRNQHDETRIRFAVVCVKTLVTCAFTRQHVTLFDEWCELSIVDTK